MDRLSASSCQALLPFESAEDGKCSGGKGSGQEYLSSSWQRGNWHVESGSHLRLAFPAQCLLFRMQSFSWAPWCRALSSADKLIWSTRPHAGTSEGTVTELQVVETQSSIFTSFPSSMMRSLRSRVHLDCVPLHYFLGSGWHKHTQIEV